jgi:hypothetical protein
VHVAVALEGGEQGGALLGQLRGRPGAGGAGLELLQVGGNLAGEGVEDDPLGLVADAGQVLQPAGGGPTFQFRRVERLDGGGGVAEGAHPVGGLTGPLEQVGDPAEGLHGIGRDLAHAVLLLWLFAWRLIAVRAGAPAPPAVAASGVNILPRRRCG